MLGDLDNAVYFNDNIDLDNDDLNNIAFFNNYTNNILFSNVVIDLVNINLNNVNIHDNLVDYGLDNINVATLIAWCKRYKQRKVCKKVINRGLMPIA